MEKVFEIKNKLKVTWNPEVRAIVDTWTTYFITLEEFKNSVLVEGLNHAKAHNGQAWIVDSSSAKGVFSQEIQKFIESDIFPAFLENGIKYFITINSKTDPVTRLTVNQYKSTATASGLQMIELNSVKDAVLWLKEESK